MTLTNVFEMIDDQDYYFADVVNMILHAMKHGNYVISGCEVTANVSSNLTTTANDIDISTGYVIINGTKVQVASDSQSLDTEYGLMSSGQASYLYIYVDANGDIQVLQATINTDGSHRPPTYSSAVPDNAVLLARVELTTGTTTLEDGVIKDIRLRNPSLTPTKGYPIPILDYIHKTGNTFDVSTQDGVVTAFYMRSDGLKFYTVGLTADTVYEYDMSTPYDPSSASYSGNSKSVTTQESSPTAITFKPDGTKMYIGGAGGIVYQYTLSTAWDVSTASYDSKSFDTTNSGMKMIEFLSDGLTVYVYTDTPQQLYQYTLGTAWDVSTETLFDTFSTSSFSNDITTFNFLADGYLAYVLDGGGAKFQLYEFGEPYNLKTISFLREYSGPILLVGDWISPDGSTIMILDNNNDVVELYETFIEIYYPHE